MNNSYNLIMTRIINMIKQDLNEEYIKKFNLSCDTIKRKKKRKLSIKELDELQHTIKDLQKIPKDEKFQDYILRHLKVFLIYGNIKKINRNNITLELTNDKETSILHITINKDNVTSTLKKDNYREEAVWKTLDNDNYYTKYQRKETDVYTNRNTSLYQTNITEEFNGFHNNQEIVTRLTSKHDNYIKDNLTEEISRKGFEKDNYKEVTNYYRQEGFIIKKHKRKYKKENIGKILNYKEYKISEDYHKNEKYLNQTGYYKDFDSKLYNPFLRGKCNVKSLYK